MVRASGVDMDRSGGVVPSKMGRTGTARCGSKQFEKKKKSTCNLPTQQPWREFRQKWEILAISTVLGRGYLMNAMLT